MQTTTGLRPSSDRKVRLYPSQKNSFGTTPGLPENGGTCPGATTNAGGCAHLKKGRKTTTCYVDSLMRGYKGVKNVLDHNRDVTTGKTTDELRELFLDEFRRFLYTEKSRGNTTMLNYRIHWSGDIPNKNYAYALADAMMEMEDIQFWSYTRSFWAVPILAGIPNFQLYISADPDNEAEALEVYENWKHHDVAICYMAKENPSRDKEKFPVRLVACPVDTGKMELEGGCHTCRMCFKEKGKNVFFKT